MKDEPFIEDVSSFLYFLFSIFQGGNSPKDLLGISEEVEINPVQRLLFLARVSPETSQTSKNPVSGQNQQRVERELGIRGFFLIVSVHELLSLKLPLQFLHHSANPCRIMRMFLLSSLLLRWPNPPRSTSKPVRESKSSAEFASKPMVIFLILSHLGFRNSHLCR